MKTKKELQDLSRQASKAILAFQRAVYDNLQESGKEYGIIGDEENGLRLTIIGRHDDPVHVVIDKVRCNQDSRSIEVHVCEEEYEEEDYWTYASDLGDAEVYLYDNIEWNE